MAIGAGGRGKGSTNCTFPYTHRFRATTLPPPRAAAALATAAACLVRDATPAASGTTFPRPPAATAGAASFDTLPALLFVEAVEKSGTGEEGDECIYI